MSQVYHWLVRAEPESEHAVKVACTGNEKDRRHLRASFL